MLPELSMWRQQLIGAVVHQVSAGLEGAMAGDVGLPNRPNTAGGLGRA